MNSSPIGFKDALHKTRTNIRPLPIETFPLDQLLGRISAENAIAQVDSPSVNASLRDGYAVSAAAISSASQSNPVLLKIAGTAPAGATSQLQLHAGETVRILTGGCLPQGADAVLAEEFVQRRDNEILIDQPVASGKNVLPRGSDVRKKDIILKKGEVFRPAALGLLAAAGVTHTRSYRTPRVAILATGDEVIAPGHPFQEGKIYASNLVTLMHWCRHFKMDVETKVVKDDFAELKAELEHALACHDAVVTSGGVWKSERDLVIRVLEDIGWQQIFHRVRMGPGKAVGFGLYNQKPVFCLPGGPPSNQIAFLHLALPGLLRLAGCPDCGLPILRARLTAAVSGQTDWTQFIHGKISKVNGETLFTPLKSKSRLQDMSAADAILTIPEGIEHLDEGSRVDVWILFRY